MTFCCTWSSASDVLPQGLLLLPWPSEREGNLPLLTDLRHSIPQLQDYNTLLLSLVPRLQSIPLFETQNIVQPPVRYSSLSQSTTTIFRLISLTSSSDTIHKRIALGRHQKILTGEGGAFDFTEGVGVFKWAGFICKELIDKQGEGGGTH